MIPGEIMLINTFIHIPGIGPSTEQKLWQSDIQTWHDMHGLAQAGLSPAKRAQIESWAELSCDHLEKNNPVFFENQLAASQQFRLFPEFRGQSVYLDIETTGLDPSAHITTIAMYDGTRIDYFIQGKNLHDFIDAIHQYKVLITYNGRSFDIPFIESYFNVQLPHAQIDLRYVLGHLGFKGGLKKCENALGIDRQALDGVDGYFAVLLWHDYKTNNNQDALETLLAYNIEDVINLETLMIHAYNRQIEKTPFYHSHCIELPPVPDVPFTAHPKTILRLKQKSNAVWF
jgi:uncharacterized protein YprB with RNaseH-like and TPR domain